MIFFIAVLVTLVAYVPSSCQSDSVRKKALIFGVAGQDGSYLSEFLLGKGYEVHGVKRRASSFNTQRIDHLYCDMHHPNVSFILHYGDVTDSLNVVRLIQEIKPDEIYNLAAQSHVAVSFEEPEYTSEADALGALRILDAVRLLGLTHTRFYQASTSEMFGKVQETPQKETTPFYPRSPYGSAKLYAHWITVNYREAYGIYACSGILFNHESPRRGETFVTRKVTRAVAAWAHHKHEILYVGNLNASRDWGYAGDYVEAMWLMLQQEKPDTYVVATGETHTVREFIERAYAEIGVAITWQGSEIDETGIDAKTREAVVRIDKRYFRPAEVEYLLGDASKARQVLGWQPKVSFAELVKMMVAADIKVARAGQT